MCNECSAAAMSQAHAQALGHRYLRTLILEVTAQGAIRHTLQHDPFLWVVFDHSQEMGQVGDAAVHFVLHAEIFQAVCSYLRVVW